MDNMLNNVKLFLVWIICPIYYIINNKSGTIVGFVMYLDFEVIVFMKTLASPINAGFSIGEGSMKKAIVGTAVPLEKMSF
jgi:hypothetical protein